MPYEPVIGLEVHAQLLTASKMFCSCRADYAGAQPNTLVCPVCLGMPGVLPVINQQAVEFAVMTALALNCTVQETSVFARKSYFYPDLPKNYQISQYDLPLSRNGWLMAETKSGQARIGVRRVHLEEDTAKLTHVEAGGETYSLIDFNRSGMPLMEIVSEPDMHSLDEVQGYITKLRTILRYLGVSSGDMEKGAMRFEANVSLRPIGSTTLGNRVEVKNLNSFRAVLRSAEYEIARQTAILDRGGAIEQETMGWDDDRNVTVTQRGKEEAHDYRYFPEPDLPPLALKSEWVESIRSRLPELPDHKRERYMRDLGLSAYDAGLLVAEREVAAYFEQCIAGQPQRAKTIANWIVGECFRLMNETGQEISQVKVTPATLNELVGLIEKGTISNTIGKDVFAEMFATGKNPAAIIAAKGLTQISDSGAIEAAIDKAIQSNPQAVADFKGGKETAIRFLVGQVMKETKGRANPSLVNQMLVEKLKRV
jgi:aspartyl-tRNA(Asn)/glutamyl-tRNA(Gln) amidotransferase subunit B